MAAKHGFWNSVKQAGGVGDRLYNAEDLSFFYDLFFTNGIACSNDEMGDMFKVSLTSGSYSVKVNNGVCIIGGKWYNGKGEAGITLSMNTSHVVSSGLSRIDAVCIKKDDTNRKFTFYIKEGTEASSPVAPDIDKTTELCLAYYTVNSSYSVAYDSLVDTRMDTDFAGCAKMKLDKPITIIDFNDYVKRYYYFCNGVDDNIKLSEIVQNFYETEKERNLEIKVIGTIGLKGFYSGEGTEDSPRAVFCLGKDVNSSVEKGNNRVTVDFTDCQPFKFSETGTTGEYVVMFLGNENYIKNARCCNACVNTNNNIFKGHKNKAENCYFKVQTAGSYTAKTVEGSGDLINCEIVASAASGAAYAVNQNNEINGLSQASPMAVTGCTILAENNTAATAEANGLYVLANHTNSVLLANNNKIATSSTKKTTNTYKINSGFYNITNNIVMKAGLVYANEACVNANNIVVANLVVDQSNYYFS